MSKIIKEYKRDYTVIHNKIIDDERLSLKAVGLFLTLWRLPNDWDFFLSDITNRHKDGKDGVNSALNELEKLGYVKRSNKHRKASGKFDSYDWKLSEYGEFSNDENSTNAEKPLRSNRDGKAAAENPQLLSTKKPSTKRLNDDDDTHTLKTADSRENDNREFDYSAFDNRPYTNKDSTNKENTKTDYDDDDTASRKTGIQPNAFDEYQKAFGNYPNSYATRDIMEHLNHLDEEVIAEAIRRTGERDKGWGYANSIMNSWEKAGVKTMQDVDQQDREHKRFHEQPSLRKRNSAKKKKNMKEIGNEVYVDDEGDVQW